MFGNLLPTDSRNMTTKQANKDLQQKLKTYMSESISDSSNDSLQDSSSYESPSYDFAEVED